MGKDFPQQLFQRDKRHVSLIPVGPGTAAIQDILIDRQVDRKTHIDLSDLPRGSGFFLIADADEDRLFFQVISDVRKRACVRSDQDQLFQE